jgi:hypothetical protein
MENIIKPSEDTEKIDNTFDTKFVSGSDDFGVLPLKSYFGKETSTEENEAIEYIYKTLGGNVQNSPELLNAIKQIEMKIGVSGLGQSKILAIKNYIKLNKELNFIKDQIREYER